MRRQARLRTDCAENDTKQGGWIELACTTSDYLWNEFVSEPSFSDELNATLAYQRWSTINTLRRVSEELGPAMDTA
jgi:hypothetical protein